MEHKLNELQRNQLISFRSCFVEHPVLTRALESMERLRRNHALGGEQHCMLLTGDTGSGKSHLIKHFASCCPDYSEEGVLMRPVLISRIPSRPDVERMIIQLLIDMGQFGAESRKERRREAGLAEALVKILQKCKTQIIIINEFQELIEFKSVEDRQRVANRLKLISEEAGIPIVLVGMPWASEIAEEPQWASRLMCRIELPYFKLSESRKEYTQFLKGLSIRMGFEEPPGLAYKDLALPLFAACSGEIRRLKHLLDESLLVALKSNAKTVKKDHLAQAFDNLFYGQINPFNCTLEELDIREVSRYAHYNNRAVGKDEALVKTAFADALSISQILKKN